MPWLDTIYWYLYNHISLFRHIRHFFLYVLKIDWYWYLVAFVLFVLAWFMYRKKKHSQKEAFILAIIIAYIFLLYASLVLSRPLKTSYQYNIELFWSVKAICKGENKYWPEIMLNLIMLLPIGLLLPIAKKVSLLKILALGILISGGIETSQLILKRGLFEFDDIIFNVTSILVGYFIYLLVKKLIMTKV